MPSEYEHMLIDELVFGRPFPEVHRWLDATVQKSGRKRHWINRHHKKAIYDKFSDEKQTKSAMLHVVIDWMAWKGKYFLPKNSKDVRERLKENGFLI